MDGLLDVPTVATLLRLSPFTIRKYIRAGRLRVLRIGRRVLVEPAEVERFVADAKKAAS